MIVRAVFAALAVLATAGDAAPGCAGGADHQVDIYPTADKLPENLLRIYLYFPRPMAVSDAAQHVRLLDAQGVPVNGVFLPTNQELWSPDRVRLTLLLDPGRVKSGLAAHEAMGRALVPGQSYSLVISGAARDAKGCTLGADTAHSFSVQEPDVATPNPADWTLDTPEAESTDPVRVHLGGPHDHLSMAYRLRIEDDAANIVPGAIALGPDEGSWLFTPRRPWRAATYALVVDERLEDLAGNRPGSLFDRPLTAAPIAWQARLPFVPTEARD